MKINLKECTNNKLKYLESLEQKTDGMSLIMCPLNSSWTETINKSACNSSKDEKSTLLLPNKKCPKI